MTQLVFIFATIFMIGALPPQLPNTHTLTHTQAHTMIVYKVRGMGDSTVASDLPGVWKTVHMCMTDYMRAHHKEFISKRQSQKMLE